MAQFYPEETFNDRLLDRVVAYLQTRDPRLFPFSAAFDEDRQAAFVRDLREALGELTDSGSARKSAATGFVTSDQALRRVIDEWQAANGDWPEGSYPQDAVTSLGSSTHVDSPPPRAYARRVIREITRESD